MIDVHSHILPGVDDGAQTVEDSLAMASEAVKEGIHTIIATPHHKNGKYENIKSSIINNVFELNSRLEKENIPLTVLPGQENRIYGEIIEDMELDNILTLNHSQYLFIEFPSSHVPRYTEQLLFDLQLKNIIPIIVHPERNQELMEQPDKLYKLVTNGALTQVTAASLAGYFGKKIKLFSQQLIEANLTHFIASDAHNTSSRGFKMGEALDFVESKFGVDMVYMFTENAELLIDEKAVFKEVPEKVRNKKFLGIF